MMEQTQQNSDTKVPSSHVRFTEIEYRRIAKMKSLLGLSIPDILKQNTFKRMDLERPLFAKEDAERIITEIKRIGNNLNQIARKINSGLSAGWNQPFNTLCVEVARLQYQVGANGVRKD